MHLIRIGFGPNFLGVKNDAEKVVMLGKLKVFVFSDLLGVKIDAKKGDILGNLKVFVLGVGCLGWVVWEGKIHNVCMGFVKDFYGVMLSLKSAILVVN